jgi:serine/threonine protein kinase/tetratricopeptide (TPR) repeat protein
MTQAEPISSAGSLDPTLARLLDEITAKLQRGEQVDLSAVLREHPEQSEELRGLLPAVAALGDLSNSGTGRSSDRATHADALAVGALGDFLIIREVGRGGMGIVFDAEQLSLNRRVALKVLPFAATMDPKQLRRFHNEAKAAASLRHEHIVHVYGVGCDRGVHYFAMEFVDGHTLADIITVQAPDRRAGLLEHAENGHRSETGPDLRALTQPRSPETAPLAFLSTERTGPKSREFYRRSAELIADAADALEHAHSLGIVHRDVKPGNLLLDHAGKVYISDFGLARFGPDAGLTMTGDLLGTLRYMAPEQALAKHGLADHRVDIYGLGASLYELLTGQPVVGGEDKQEILRRIAFEEPVAPRKLVKAIPAELETIALKCLEKNPTERYATAGELAADLRRWVEDKPIVAKPLSVMGRIDKWARRHKYLTRSAVLVITLIAVGLGIGAVLLDREKRRAVTAEQTATAVKDFFVHDLLKLAVAEAQAEQLGDGILVDPDLKVCDVLVRAAREIEGKFPDQPLVEAEIRNTLGWTLMRANLQDQALLQLERARAIRSAILGPDHPDTLACRGNLVRCLAELGRTDDALNLCRESLALATARLGPDHPQTLRCMNALGAMYGNLNVRRAEAVRLHEQAFTIQKATLGSDHLDTRKSMGNLALAYDRLGRYPEALELRKELLAVTKAKFGPDHPATLGAMGHVANSYDNAGRPAEALKFREEAQALRKARLGPDHPDTLANLYGLATTYDALGRHAEALKLREETLERMRAKLGPDHPTTLGSIGDLAWRYAALGRHVEAVKLRDEALTRRKVKLGPDHTDTLSSMHELALSFAALGRHADAIKLNEQTLARRRVKPGPDHADTLSSMNNLASNYAAVGRHPEAVKLRDEALTRRKSTLGADHIDTLGSMVNLGLSYGALGRHPEAIELFEDALPILKVKFPDHDFTFNCMNSLAVGYAITGRHSEALKLFEETLEHRKSKLGPDHLATLSTMSNLAIGYDEVGRHSDALRLRQELLALYQTRLGPDHPDTLRSMDNLAGSYAVLGRPADAIELCERALALRKVKLGPHHLDTLATMTYLANSYDEVGRRSDALKLREELVPLRKAGQGPDHPDTLGSIVNLANSYAVLGRRAEALKLYEDALPIMKGKIPSHVYTFNCTCSLALSYAALGRHAEAVKLYEDALAPWRVKPGPDRPDKLKTMHNLALSYSALGRHSEALSIREELLAATKAKLGADHPRTAIATYDIACVHALMIPKSGDARKQADLAMDWLRRALAAGYRNVDHMKKDTDLAALRDRDDFTKLLTELEAARKPAAVP